MKNLWDLHDQQDRKPRVALTLPSIVRAAIAIADTDGIEAVSMQDRKSTRLNSSHI